MLRGMLAINFYKWCFVTNDFNSKSEVQKFQMVLENTQFEIVSFPTRVIDMGIT